ncbi:MAG: hypothetical protein MUC47_03950, partial [Candidatus Kapabacteria bacterium]|nr:hypothetical protein [Candidatus Kapabacteria bacterium]
YLFGALDVRDARVFRVGSRVLSSMQACSVVASELDILDARLQQQVEHINAEMALVNPISTRIAEIAKYVDSKVRVKGSDVNDISSNYGMPMVKHLVQLGKEHGLKTTGLFHRDSLLLRARWYAGKMPAVDFEVKKGSRAIAALSEAVISAYYDGSPSRVGEALHRGLIGSHYARAFRVMNSWIVDSVEKLAATSSVFAIVEPSRLMGPEGIVAQLQARGWMVEPVHSDSTLQIPRPAVSKAESSRFEILTDVGKRYAISIPGRRVDTEESLFNGSSSLKSIAVESAATGSKYLAFAVNKKGKRDNTMALLDGMKALAGRYRSEKRTIGAYRVLFQFDSKTESMIATWKVGSIEFSLWAMNASEDELRAIVLSTRKL